MNSNKSLILYYNLTILKEYFEAYYCTIKNRRKYQDMTVLFLHTENTMLATWTSSKQELLKYFSHGYLLYSTF